MTSAQDRSFDIRPMTERDYPQVRDILQAGMDTGQATFEGEAPDWLGFSHHRIMDLAFVAVDGDKVLGWITATPASHREVFRGVIEDSIYVSADAKGRGVAGSLLDYLISDAESQGYWAMHSSIFPENESSVKLHESRGFQKVGILHSMAQMTYGPKKGKWRHNLIMEKVLEKGPAWGQYKDEEAAGELL
ncbi:GNAT family N-acetyltransferase [Corynebacterium auriscanis]|uniref:Acetyltransferase n=1 Tax=Corynebacterium auriscanis TaxID=99807 RepID=A0A0A2DJV2_9CORY|nr:GNAT family N-acetyltransferase [Corynebacterium auriscanis]KGM18042.1 acetyltransferase [Corynebacterium auriscanis]WJY73164.1 Phosphinothricin N-acetyltransferase [Corynebacterium auriscanis]